MLDRKKVRELLALDNVIEYWGNYGFKCGQRGNLVYFPNTDPDTQAIVQILQNRYDRIFAELTADNETCSDSART